MNEWMNKYEFQRWLKLSLLKSIASKFQRDLYPWLLVSHSDPATTYLQYRSAEMLSLPFCKLKAASPAFCFAAPTVWNNLSEQVK